MAFQRLRNLVARKGAPAEAPKERSLDLARLYHSLRRDSLNRVDETTWQDLAMDEVFLKLDRTSSLPGQQILYHRMRVLEPDGAALVELTRQYAAIQAAEVWAVAARKTLSRLRKREAAWLPALLMDGIPEGPRHPWVFYGFSIAPALCFAVSFWSPAFLLVAFAMVIPNIVINEIQGRRMTGYFPSLSQLHGLLGASIELAALPGTPDLPQVAFMQKNLLVLKIIRSRLGVLAVDRTQLPELVSALFGYMNLLFLLDIVAFLRALPALRRHQVELISVLEQFGSLDASMAVASCLKDLPCVTVPVFSEGLRLEVRDLQHPLLADPVGNDLYLDGKSALITGSNMAGKTTFIRTVGINVLLAQTLHFCLAERATIPRTGVLSSIRRADNLEVGQSYYFVELKRILEFLELPGDRPRLLLIDEIFRGTNTVERVAASIAVLRHLGLSHLIMVTTHDVELAEPLAEGYELFHFSEQVVDGTCAFDYNIHRGPSRSRNAIRLLELNGFPVEVTEEAKRLADPIHT